MNEYNMHDDEIRGHAEDENHNEEKHNEELDGVEEHDEADDVGSEVSRDPGGLSPGRGPERPTTQNEQNTP